MSGRKPLRQRIARQVMHQAVRLAARIDRRSDVTYGCTISHHQPQAWRTSTVAGGGPGGGGGGPYARGGLIGYGGDGSWPATTTVNIPDQPKPKQ